ncbi:MAG: hypothetical protein IPO85_01340 [Saprospiraceae bacterium]|uniref:Uncharacterized protein n=1 Tax=Candidatus Defluviibacterium haderslevense TaxID=2981993 RepID=A0A9D7XD23_9BACT|nr:hypothetical protein [Candidatus Defluviibacterium haderslevense]
MKIHFIVTLFSKSSLRDFFNLIISEFPIEFEIGMVEVNDLEFKTSEFMAPYFETYGDFGVRSKKDSTIHLAFVYCREVKIYSNKDDSREVIRVIGSCNYSENVFNHYIQLSKREEVFFSYIANGNYWFEQGRLRHSEENKVERELYSVQSGFLGRIFGKSEEKLKEKLLNLIYKYPGTSASRISGYFNYEGNQTMYFGPEFYHFIPKDFILNFKDAYCIEQLPNDIIRMQLYERLEDANDPISQNRQRSFRHYFKMVDHIDQNKIDYEEWPWLKDDSNFGVKIQHFQFPRMYIAITSTLSNLMDVLQINDWQSDQDWNKAVELTGDEKILFISPEYEGWVWIGGECLFNDIKDLYKDKLLQELSKRFGEVCSWIYISINDVHEIRWYKDGKLHRAIHHCGEDGRFAHKEDLTESELEMVNKYVNQLKKMKLKITEKKRSQIAKSIIINNMEPIFNSWCPNIIELKEQESFRSKQCYTMNYKSFYKAILKGK